MIVLEDFLPYRLNRLASALSARTQAIYRRHYDLTVPAWRVLVSLAAEDGLTAKELGRRSAMHKTKVSRAIKALEARRWLVRAPNPLNGREAFVSLTSLGRRSYAEMVPSVERFERRLVERLDGGRSRVLDLLDEMERALASETRGRDAPERGTASAPDGAAAAGPSSPSPSLPQDRRQPLSDEGRSSRPAHAAIHPIGDRR